MFLRILFKLLHFNLQIGLTDERKNDLKQLWNLTDESKDPLFDMDFVGCVGHTPATRTEVSRIFDSQSLTNVPIVAIHASSGNVGDPGVVVQRKRYGNVNGIFAFMEIIQGGALAATTRVAVNGAGGYHYCRVICNGRTVNV